MCKKANLAENFTFIQINRFAAYKLCVTLWCTKNAKINTLSSKLKECVAVLGIFNQQPFIDPLTHSLLFVILSLFIADAMQRRLSS